MSEARRAWLAPLIYLAILCLLGGLGFALAKYFPAKITTKQRFSLNGADSLNINSADLIDDFHSITAPDADVQAPADDPKLSDAKNDSNHVSETTPEVP